MAELQQLDYELPSLRAERPGLFWPMSMLIVGGSVTVTVAAVSLLAWAASRERRYG